MRRILVALCSALALTDGFQLARLQHRVQADPSALTTMMSTEPSDDDETWVEASPPGSSRRDLIYNVVGAGLLGWSGVTTWNFLQTTGLVMPAGDEFTRLPNTQFLAALGDPKASSGTGAENWGLWQLDPGPRGVWLRDYETDLVQTGDKAPRGWIFDKNDWWLEEHGLIMEAPKFPMAAGRYLVTGGRSVVTGLTVSSDGSWKLDEGSLYDVTHLPCRSARYTPLNASTNGSPLTANPKDFPVKPGAIMPSVPGCQQQDYAVLFVVGKAA